ncbi:hypothetical protein OG989_16600 [Micromonospora sp. NBC_01740]|uniref:hypothetical protein n=1 Tax=Micromonospora sp. NBC_01740 TaxID=2975986 RepID=UPI002E1590F4|nr:hypothetical protein OG989_16600 [Micromonospora sp. NBC_01740]
MTPDLTDVNRRLDAALAGVAAAFRGMTAHRRESNCECHWGSAEELALLKTPDAPLDEELLRRTYWTTDWHYPGPLLRRILPPVTRRLAAGEVESVSGMDPLARLFVKGRWQDWPAAQRDAVREFLAAWWQHTLVDPGAKVPAHEALAFVAEVSGQLAPWLYSWARLLADPTARRRLVAAADEWSYDLVVDRLPWSSWRDEEDTACLALSMWVLRHAPAALREHDASAELRDLVQLLALPDADRWDRRG